MVVALAGVSLPIYFTGLVAQLVFVHQLHWFPGGHLAQVGRADALRAVRRQLDALGLTRP